MRARPAATGRLAALALLALVLTACGGPSSTGENAHVQTLPNSLMDTSAHVAQREVPTYGPQQAQGSTATGPAATGSTATGPAAGSDHAEARGQVLYAPVYSHIFQRSVDREMALAATLSIRNTSTSRPIHIHKVDYFDSEGTLLQSYLEESGARTLGPLASTYVVIEKDDMSGGVGANFIIEWQSDRPVAPPLVETVMISTVSSQGISLTSPARVIEAW